jgi:hypothetical protein
MTSRSSRTRATSVALPRLSSGSRPGLAGPLFHANVIETQPSRRAKLSHRTITHRADLNVASKILQGHKRKTNPGKISPAAPRTFRTTLNRHLEVGHRLCVRFHPCRSARRVPRPRVLVIHFLGGHRLPASRNSLGSVFGYSHHRELWRGFDCLTPARLDCFRVDVRELKPSIYHQVNTASLFGCVPHLTSTNSQRLSSRVFPKEHLAILQINFEGQGKAMRLALR